MGGIAQRIFGKPQPKEEPEGTGDQEAVGGGSMGFGQGDDAAFGGTGSDSAVGSYQSAGTGTQPSGDTFGDPVPDESLPSGDDDVGDSDVIT